MSRWSTPKSRAVNRDKDTRYRRMTQMAKQGVKRKEIAAHFGVSENTVYVAIRKYWNEK